MKVTNAMLSGLVVVDPVRYDDDRGYFVELWNEARYADVGVPTGFVQDNLSLSQRGVLRGLHYQEPHAQGKLVTVLRGEVFDVAVDLRLGSPTFGQWEAYILSGENGRQLYVPEGFAHGFVTLSESALFAYKCTDYYQPQCEATIKWNDPDIAIDWPITTPVVSAKDQAGRLLQEVKESELPTL